MPLKRIEQTRSAKKSRMFEKRYISAPELATRWSVSRSAIYHGNCSSSTLHAIRFGRSVRFLLSEVEAFEKTRERQSEYARDG